VEHQVGIPILMITLLPTVVKAPDEPLSMCHRRRIGKKVEFMLDKLGEEYDGVITGVTQFGFFVELDHLFVEGLVHITWLPDYFSFYPERFCLVGQRTGQTYRLGDRVRVRVNNVSLARRQIDFALLAKW